MHLARPTIFFLLAVVLCTAAVSAMPSMNDNVAPDDRTEMEAKEAENIQDERQPEDR